jgi:hypothetical protein
MAESNTIQTPEKMESGPEGVASRRISSRLNTSGDLILKRNLGILHQAYRLQENS